MRNLLFVFGTFFLIAFFISSPAKLSAQQKMDGKTRLALAGQNPSGEVKLLVKVSAGATPYDLGLIGFTVNTRVGSIWSISGKAIHIKDLNKSALIQRIEYGGQMVPARRLDDSAHKASFVHLVQQQRAAGVKTSYTGKGVLVGVVDIGFQPDHPTFFDTTGSRYRVKRFWDQMDISNTGPTPFSYGRLYTDSAEMMTFSDLDEMHGTHVAGIAAGSGLGSINREFGGVAYDADIIMVGIRHRNDTLPGSAYADYYIANAAIIDAYDYIFRYADSMDMSCVINLSWGLHTGPHDGTSLFDQAVDQLVGRGKIVVGAAGNDGFSKLHIEHEFTGDTVHSIVTDTRRLFSSAERVFFDMWGSAGSDLSIAFHLCDTGGNILASTSFFTASSDALVSGELTISRDTTIDTLSYELACVGNYAGNNSPNFNVILKNHHRSRCCLAISVTSDSSHMHAWNSGNPYDWSHGDFHDRLPGRPLRPGFINGNSKNCVSENGGTGDNTISVGAYAAVVDYTNIDNQTVPTYYNAGQYAWFSSQGPRIDGRIKPDISAPGVEVISAYNRFLVDSLDPASSVVSNPVWMGRTHYYGASSGTSMAAPHVAGIVALLLQANDSLNPAEVLDILKLSAYSDFYTGAVPNPYVGWGKVNAYAAILLAQAPVGTAELQKPEFRIYPNPSSGTFRLLSPINLVGASYRIYDQQGRIALEGRLDSESLEPNLDNGLYWLQIESNGQSHTEKMAVMH